MDANKANLLAQQIAKRLEGKKESFPKAMSSLSAIYRVRATFQGMRLHIHVGDRVLTTWVQNFKLSDPFTMLAFVANEPERASALVNETEVGLSVPVFINDQLYCDADLVRQFARDNVDEINALQLKAEESFAVQRLQIRLRLVTDDISRFLAALAALSRIFHRYTEADFGALGKTRERL